MLLTRSLPPQFLLPAWSTRKLCQILQRAYSSEQADKRKASQRTKKGTNLALSLFDQLFPEEKGKDNSGRESNGALPPFQWDEGFGSRREEIRKQDGRGQHKPYSTAGQKKLFKEQVTPLANQSWERRKGNVSVLILNCASKTLEESDFFRVSPRGEHIEGWTRSIIKVIQSRDNNTLEPLGTYFIYFASEPAAREYLDQIMHLHRLARADTGSLKSATLPPPPGFLRPNEDLKTALRTFSLVPGHGKLSIRLATQPLKASIIQMLDDGGPSSMAKFHGMDEGMVIFSVDVGHIKAFELKSALDEDGRRRNLLWELAENGISALTSNQQDDVKEREKEDLLGDDDTESEKDATKRAFRTPSRYVLAFKDRYEARRFVREWHRRPFPIKKEISPGDEPPPIVNAEIIW